MSSATAILQFIVFSIPEPGTSRFGATILDKERQADDSHVCCNTGDLCRDSPEGIEKAMQLFGTNRQIAPSSLRLKTKDALAIILETLHFTAIQHYESPIAVH